jgi:hypothetical protein
VSATERLDLCIYLPGDDNKPSIRSPVPDELVKGLDAQTFPESDVDEFTDYRATLVMHFQISPFPITREGVVKVRMMRGEDELRMGTLRVRTASPPVS